MSETKSQAKGSSPKSPKSSTKVKEATKIDQVKVQEVEAEKENKPIEELGAESDDEVTSEQEFIELLLYRIDSLENHCQKLELAISKFATLTGNSNYLKEFGFDRWEPGKIDMTKYKS